MSDILGTKTNTDLPWYFVKKREHWSFIFQVYLNNSVTACVRESKLLKTLHRFQDRRLLADHEFENVCIKGVKEIEF